MVNKFEAGLFYKHDTTEYEYNDEKEDALYCSEIRNANEGRKNHEHVQNTASR
jgi:hypothetical protein